MNTSYQTPTTRLDPSNWGLTPDLRTDVTYMRKLVDKVNEKLRRLGIKPKHIRYPEKGYSYEPQSTYPEIST